MGDFNSKYKNGVGVYRSRTDKIIAGVCGGLGEYFNLDPLIFRLIFLFLLFANGGGLLLYIVLAILLPKQPLVGSVGAGTDPRTNFHEFVQDFRQSAHAWAGEVRQAGHDYNSWEHRRLWLGLIIVVVGVAALMNQLFPQPWLSWNVLWPVAIIVFGIAVITKGSRSR